MDDARTPEGEAEEAATAFMHHAIPMLGHMGIRVLVSTRGAASVLLPHAPNSNHLGTVYAGSLLSAAECLGGSIGFAQGIEGAVPIVSRMEIDYLKPATTDIVAATTLSEDDQQRVHNEVSTQGKSRFTLAISLQDAEGAEVARALGHYQLRRL